jgi:TIR domain-containing protein
LKSADIVILLVSNDFLASKYCNEVELATALDRHKNGEARVVPVILRPCDWHSSRFGHLQALPKDGKPVTAWKTREGALLNVVQGLRKVAAELRNRGTAIRGEDLQSILTPARDETNILQGLPSRWRGQVDAFLLQYLGTAGNPVPFGGRESHLRALDE